MVLCWRNCRDNWAREYFLFSVFFLYIESTQMGPRKKNRKYPLRRTTTETKLTMGQKKKQKKKRQDRTNYNKQQFSLLLLLLLSFGFLALVVNLIWLWPTNDQRPQPNRPPLCSASGCLVFQLSFFCWLFHCSQWITQKATRLWPFAPVASPPHCLRLCALLIHSMRCACLLFSLSLSVSAFLTLSSLLCVSQLSPQSTWSILIIASLNYPAPPHSPPLAPPLITPGGVTQAEWSVQINWAKHVMPYNRNLSHWSLHALSSARLGSAFSPAKGNDLGEVNREGERVASAVRKPEACITLSLHTSSFSFSSSFVLCDNVVKVSHVVAVRGSLQANSAPLKPADR